MAFTLVELVLTVTVLAIGLVIITKAVTYVRNQGMGQFTREVLSRTDQALQDYHRRFDAWPPDRFDLGQIWPSGTHRPRTEGVECLLTVLAQAYPQGVPFWSSVRFQRALANTDDDRNRDGADRPELFELVDGWGRPLLYYDGYGAGPDKPPRSIPTFEGVSERDMNRLNASLAERWLHKDRRPLLDSAGPDGQFDNSDDVRLSNDERAGDEDEQPTSQYN